VPRVGISSEVTMKKKRSIKKKASFGRILWAVDPFSGTRKLQEKVIPLLQSLSEGTAASVEPVYLVGPNAFQLPAAIFADSTRESTDALEKKLVQYIGGLELSIMAAPKMLGTFPFSPSLRDGADKLLSYARKNHADLIVLTTRAKKGMPRFFLGSFAETLLLRTSVPILLVNPLAAPPTRIKRLLFTAELRGSDSRGLSLCVGLAKTLGCEIAIFHKLESLGIPYRPTQPVFLESEKERRMKELARLALWSKKQGIEADVIFDVESGDIASAITENARDVKGTLIVISPQVGPVSRHFLGSTTLKVVRSSASPVLIMPPRSMKAR